MKYIASLLFIFLCSCTGYASTFVELKQGAPITAIEKHCMCTVSKQEVYSNVELGNKRITRVNQRNLLPGLMTIHGPLEAKVAYYATLADLKTKVFGQRIQPPEKLEPVVTNRPIPRPPLLALAMLMLTAAFTLSLCVHKISRLNKVADTQMMLARQRYAEQEHMRQEYVAEIARKRRLRLADRTNMDDGSEIPLERSAEGVWTKV